MSGEAPASLRLSVAYEAAGLGQFIPEEAKLTVVFGHPNLGAVETRILIPSIDIRNPARVCGASTGVESTTASKGLVGAYSCWIPRGPGGPADTLRFSHDPADGFFLYEESAKP